MFVMRYFGHEHHVCGIGKRPSNPEAMEAMHHAWTRPALIEPMPMIEPGLAVASSS
jgi:hypothetical protein